MKLKPWYDIVKPREDLREGKLQDARAFLFAPRNPENMRNIFRSGSCDGHVMAKLDWRQRRSHAFRSNRCFPASYMTVHSCDGHVMESLNLFAGHFELF